MVDVLNGAFGIRRGLLTTVHSYTGDQNLIDGPTRICAEPARRPPT